MELICSVLIIFPLAYISPQHVRLLRIFAFPFLRQTTGCSGDKQRARGKQSFPPRSNVFGSFTCLFREISFTVKWKHEQGYVTIAVEFKCILISLTHKRFKSFHSVFHSFHGLMNSINWPASSIWVFIAQLGEHCSANAEATGSNRVEAPKIFFFRAIFAIA